MASADIRRYPALIFYNDDGACLTEGADDPAAEAAKSFTSLVHEVLEQLVRLPQFPNVILLQSSEPFMAAPGAEAGMSLAVAVGAVVLNANGEVLKVYNERAPLNIEQALTAGISGLPEKLRAMVAMVAAPGPEAGQDDGELVQPPELQISNAKLAAEVVSLNKRIKLGNRYNTALTEDAEIELTRAVDERRQEAVETGAVDAGASQAPIQLGELVELLSAYMLVCLSVDSSPNLVQRGLNVFRAAGRMGLNVLSAGKVRRNMWRIEEVAVRCGRLAAKLAIKSIRPIIIGLIIHRAFQTLDASQNLDVRTARQPEEEQADFYYSQLLGEDWETQFEGDMAEALQEVDEGLVTEDINHDKRRVQASILRRLEIEEWDKARMKLFYYSSFGMGPWYAEMEEKLTNPYFLGARAWNGGADNWVGDNTIFPNDIPAHQTSNVERNIQTLEQARGVRLSARQKAVLRSSEKIRPSHQVTSAGALASGLVDPNMMLGDA